MGSVICTILIGWVVSSGLLVFVLSLLSDSSWIVTFVTQLSHQ